MKMLCIGIAIFKNFMILVPEIRAWLEGDLRLAIRLFNGLILILNLKIKIMKKINQNIKQLD